MLLTSAALWHQALLWLSCSFSSCFFHPVLCRKIYTCPTKREFVQAGEKETTRNSTSCLHLCERDLWRHKSQTLPRNAKEYSKGNDHKMQLWGYRLDGRKTFLTKRVGQHWDRLSDTVRFLSLEDLNTLIGKLLSVFLPTFFWLYHSSDGRESQITTKVMQKYHSKSHISCMEIIITTVLKGSRKSSFPGQFVTSLEGR